MTSLSFLGGAGTVTGSRFLLTGPEGRLLVDCGLFQGLKQLRLRNRDPFPVPPEELRGVVLTHAHLDHSGYLPALVRDGFAGPVVATAATCDLSRILLLDSAHLQEEEAEFANRAGYSKHHPALPLYTRADAEAALARLRPVRWVDTAQVAGCRILFRRAGHIPGAASVEVRERETTLVFSGDLGRPLDPLMYSPAPVKRADYLILESTYGDRLHGLDDPRAALGETVRRTAARGGVIVIPAFAVGRAQTLLYHLWSLTDRGEIPRLPVFVDSPMATEVTRVGRAHAEEYRIPADDLAAALAFATFTRSVDDSKAISQRGGPMIVISASGMATGGRVLFHLERFAPDHRNTILLVGHQAAGTRGEAIQQGAREVKIHGRMVPVGAEVVSLEGLSAHADADEILRWLGGFEAPPRMTFLTHGEPPAAEALRARIASELGWPVRAAVDGERVELT
jgi:metallo-beta-lactamase family protein